MRDTISPTKLNPFAEECKEVLDSIKDDIESKAIGDERITEILAYRFETAFQLTIANYSSGSAKADVQVNLLNSIDAFEQGFKWEGFENTYGGYDEMIWMVSLGILCDIDLADFKRITAILKRDGVEDALLNFLIKSKQPDWNQRGSYIIQKSPYGGLEKIISETDETKGIERLKTYLSKEWYKGHDDAAWHDSHKNTKVNSYFGYWAWETSALVKVKGWDDSTLQDTLYYPYDAVHW